MVYHSAVHHSTAQRSTAQLNLQVAPTAAMNSSMAFQCRADARHNEHEALTPVQTTGVMPPQRTLSPQRQPGIGRCVARPRHCTVPAPRSAQPPSHEACCSTLSSELWARAGHPSKGSHHCSRDRHVSLPAHMSCHRGCKHKLNACGVKT